MSPAITGLKCVFLCHLHAISDHSNVCNTQEMGHKQLCKRTKKKTLKKHGRAKLFFPRCVRRCVGVARNFSATRKRYREFYAELFSPFYAPAIAEFLINTLRVAVFGFCLWRAHHSNAVNSILHLVSSSTTRIAVRLALGNNTD